MFYWWIRWDGLPVLAHWHTGVTSCFPLLVSKEEIEIETVCVGAPGYGEGLLILLHLMSLPLTAVKSLCSLPSWKGGRLLSSTFCFWNGKAGVDVVPFCRTMLRVMSVSRSQCLIWIQVKANKTTHRCASSLIQANHLILFTSNTS